MDGFPSGQRERTVNPLSQTTMVRIHPRPPFFLFCGNGGIGRRVRFRSVWGQLHAGSSPVSRTISSVHNGFNVMNTRFFMLLLESRHFACSPSLCGDIFHGHALSRFGNIMACQRRCRDVDVPHKAVVNCDSLCSTFSDALRFVHLDNPR